METASRCPNGVARVETQLSFANQLVSFLTLGIFTPMSIQVSCAAAPAGDDLVIRQDGSQSVHEVFDRALALSEARRSAVWIAFD